MAVATAASYELTKGIEHPVSWATVEVAASSVAFNGLLSAKPLLSLRRRAGQRATEPERDIIKHILAVDMPSSVLALGGSLLQKYGVSIEGIETEKIAAIASGLFGAWVFRPTLGNLGHQQRRSSS